MDLPDPVAERLARLAPDQRTAATAPPGPVLCVAPAGSGKTTTLVARIAWLVATGVPPGRIAAITFNRRAAEDLAERLVAALAWLPDQPTEPADATRGVCVRTFHALGLDILRGSPQGLGRLVDRTVVLQAQGLAADQQALRRLDTAFSRLKLDFETDRREMDEDLNAGPIQTAFAAYEAALASAAAMDFDDLIRLALRRLRADPALLERWRRRCEHLLVDETQDVDPAQLELALLLAEPGNQVFFVGDDDQSIYGWRLANVRRILGLAGRLPGLRRIDLEVNYRCPAPVVDRAVRLVERNTERFAKAIRPGPSAAGRLVLAPDGSDATERARHVLQSWGGADGTWAILARTNRELLPAAAVAVDLGIPFRAPGLRLLLDEPWLDEALSLVEAGDQGLPLLARIVVARAAAHRSSPSDAADPSASTLDDAGLHVRDEVQGSWVELSVADLLGALLAWAPAYRDAAAFGAAVRAARDRLADLRRDDARLTLATAHATKGLEFDHVAVVGMDARSFPSARSLADAEDPRRALEEERRLAYVAWTRARRSLTLVYDPLAPSPFLLEAFEAQELGVLGP